MFPVIQSHPPQTPVALPLSLSSRATTQTLETAGEQGTPVEATVSEAPTVETQTTAALQHSLRPATAPVAVQNRCVLCPGSIPASILQAIDRKQCKSKQRYRGQSLKSMKVLLPVESLRAEQNAILKKPSEAEVQGPDIE
jgi:hypothetical protein